MVLHLFLINVFLLLIPIIGIALSSCPGGCAPEDSVELIQKRVDVQPTIEDSVESVKQHIDVQPAEDSNDNSHTLEYKKRTSFYGRPAMFLKRASGDGSRVTIEPPRLNVPYQLEHPSKGFFSQHGQDECLWPELLGPITEYYLSRGREKDGEKQSPFFVESGARNGEDDSNTLFLERAHGWNGLLIEPSNVEYPRLVEKNRKCYSWQGCLSPTGRSEDVQFLDEGNGRSKVGKGEETMTVQAESLLSLLQGINKDSNVHTVDFWSLDIEGSEPPVLETTDFQAIEFGVLMIEMNKSEESNKRIRKVMQENNFREIGGTRYDVPGGILDFVFVNPAYFEARGISIPERVEKLTPPGDRGSVQLRP